MQCFKPMQYLLAQTRLTRVLVWCFSQTLYLPVITHTLKILKLLIPGRRSLIQMYVIILHRSLSLRNWYPYTHHFVSNEDVHSNVQIWKRTSLLFFFITIKITRCTTLPNEHATDTYAKSSRVHYVHDPFKDSQPGNVTQTYFTIWPAINNSGNLDGGRLIRLPARGATGTLSSGCL